MDPIVEKIIMSAIGVVVPALITWLGAQIVKYRKKIKETEDKNIKAAIENALSPIQTGIETLTTDVNIMTTDIGNMKTDIVNLQNSEINFSTRLKPMQDEIEHLKDDIQELLTSFEKQGLDLENMRQSEEILQKETRSAWRYRIRQLCHVYMERGCMTADEYDQLQKMFGIYEAIGGNGQTKDLYDRTKILPIKPKEEVEYLDSKK